MQTVKHSLLIALALFISSAFAQQPVGQVKKTIVFPTVTKNTDIVPAAFQPKSATAQQIEFRVDGMNMRSLAKVLYGEILETSYVLDETISDKTVSVRVSANKAAIGDTMTQLLEAHGVEASKIGGVWFLRPARPDGVLVTHRVKHRSPDELSAIMRLAFPTVQAVKNDQPDIAPPPSPQAQGQGQAQGQANKKTDEGKNDVSVKSPIPGDVLVFRLPARDVVQARELLAELDKPQPSVQVQAIAYEVSTDGSKAAAIDMAMSLINAKLNVNISSGATLPGASAVTISTPDFSAVARVLDNDGRFKSVTRPSVRVRSGGKARFSVGQEVPTLGGVTTTNGASQQSVIYRQSGTIFEVSPVVRDGAVDLSVVQIVSSFGETRSSTLNSPTLNKRELASELTLQPGELIAIAGLEHDESAGSERSLFGIPVGRTGSDSKRQTLLLLEVTRL